MCSYTTLWFTVNRDICLRMSTCFWTLIFCKVVFRCVYGLLRFLITALLQISYRICQWKVWNLVKVWWSYSHEFGVSLFYGTPCTLLVCWSPVQKSQFEVCVLDSVIFLGWIMLKTMCLDLQVPHWRRICTKHWKTEQKCWVSCWDWVSKSQRVALLISCCIKLWLTLVISFDSSTPWVKKKQYTKPQMLTDFHNSFADRLSEKFATN